MVVTMQVGYLHCRTKPVFYGTATRQRRTKDRACGIMDVLELFTFAEGKLFCQSGGIGRRIHEATLIVVSGATPP